MTTSYKCACRSFSPPAIISMSAGAVPPAPRGLGDIPEVLVQCAVADRASGCGFAIETAPGVAAECGAPAVGAAEAMDCLAVAGRPPDLIHSLPPRIPCMADRPSPVHGAGRVPVQRTAALRPAAFRMRDTVRALILAVVAAAGMAGTAQAFELSCGACRDNCVGQHIQLWNKGRERQFCKFRWECQRRDCGCCNELIERPERMVPQSSPSWNFEHYSKAEGSRPFSSAQRDSDRNAAAYPLMVSGPSLRLSASW